LINSREVKMDKFKKARETMRKTFEKDTDFAETYVANIAMLLHDRYGLLGHKERNNAATDIMELIFW